MLAHWHLPDTLGDSTRRILPPMTATSDIGPALRAARRRLGLTQQEVADLAGLSDRTVRDLEKGSSSPSLGAVIAVATVLGLRLEVTG